MASPGLPTESPGLPMASPGLRMESLGLRQDFDAVILAGGRAARMDGADKPGLEVGGRPMLVSVAAAAAAAGAARLVVVGPERGGAVGRGLAAAASGLPGGLVIVREDPPGGGPVPALRCGLAAARSPWVALLAADLPFLTGSWLARLLALARTGISSGTAGRHAATSLSDAGVAAGPGSLAGAVLADGDGRPQWLAGCWRTDLLRSALRGYGGDSLGGLMRPLGALLVAEAGDGPAPWLDCDDPSQLAAARAAAWDGER
jgi:molybdopterin-guanine dinucleotide biosynthesis protein A